MRKYRDDIYAEEHQRLRCILNFYLARHLLMGIPFPHIMYWGKCGEYPERLKNLFIFYEFLARENLSGSVRLWHR